MSTSGHAGPERSERANGFLLVGAMAVLMWVVEIVDSLADHRLDAYGIVPRRVDGLDGVLFSPFLHGSFGHLLGNTVPFLVLGAVIAFNGAIRVLLVTLIVGLVAGVGTWLIAPDNTITVGASGIVMGYATYLMARGLFSRKLLELLVGFAVLVVWGGALLWALVPREGVSWQAHLCGGVGGVVAAWVLTTDPRRRGSAAPARRSPLDAL
ncbi:rhomboid family intramembrane serine protease [Patulibacter sp. SYSU D01012]|uniref:rhomboid family intramembrane serine protease n=1 Tax=Patulibacter sp. SYSU D01012 TaxID=2817381 RepID=UPI001B30E0EF|nr:rhomboid family intramembrane serine protease [Patulibacter sp. SYSU D01012]